MNDSYDAVVVGAGPYGLSAAAHLLGKGLKVGVFGTPLEMWRRHMPKGMLLRSHWWATNLSDPRGAFGLKEFFAETGRRPGYPVPLATFVEYGLWFQQHAVPGVDATHVAAVRRSDGGFELALQDRRTVECAAVVVATGPFYYARRPEQFAGLPPALVSHSCEHADFTRFKGKTVIVVGAGQSAIEYTALLHEAGASVHVVCRRPIKWLDPDTSDERSLLQRLRAPNAQIAAGWENWVWDHLPYLFSRFSQEWRDNYNAVYHSGASDWLRERVIGRATLHEGRTIERLQASGERLQAKLSDGTALGADHVLLATGFQVDVARLPMLHPSLTAEIRADAGVPDLSRWFESSVPGLYFLGITSVRNFGPLYRFVAGCGAAARRVAGAVARGRDRARRAA